MTMTDERKQELVDWITRLAKENKVNDATSDFVLVLKDIETLKFLAPLNLGKWALRTADEIISGVMAHSVLSGFELDEEIDHRVVEEVFKALEPWVRPNFKELRALSEPTTGVKYDDVLKASGFHLIPQYPLEQIAAVFAYGAKKYAPHNWTKGMDWSRLFDAVIRHVFSFWRGENLDPESGLPHLAHAIVNLMFLLQYADNWLGTDDRNV